MSIRHAHPRHLKLAATLSLATAAALLSACSRTDDSSTAGQKLDSVIATAKDKADEVKNEVQAAGHDAGTSIKNATADAAEKSRDLAITAAVKAKLAGDKNLSATAIEVDTAEGRVVLRGSAPDSAARARAAELALAVSGVVAVENHLEVQPKG